MSPAVRAVCGALLALFLGWQAVVAAIALAREAAATPLSERKRALVASEYERVETSLAWIELYRAIERHSPKESIVAVCFPLDETTFGAYYQVVPMLFPRRVIPVTRAYSVEDVEGTAEAARKLPVPSYIVDFRSGFPLPQRRSRLAEGRDFTLWRVDP
jgi:hypothetical protein